MAREMTSEEKKEYDRLVAGMQQMQLRLDELSGPATYGYARVSSPGQAAGNSLRDQETQLKAAGEEKVYSDIFTGTKLDRPELQKLISLLRAGDTLIVTKLDRLGRSVSQASALITELLDAGITINVLNLGVLDNGSVSTLMRNVLLSFAQFERDMILERTQEGKAIARLQPGYREGRPRKYSRAQLDHAMNLLNDYSYTQVSAMTGISKSSLVRERKRRRTDGCPD